MVVDFSRRRILAGAAAGSAAVMAASLLPANAEPYARRDPGSLPQNSRSRRYRPADRFGLGGVAFGNAFTPATEEEFLGAMETAWNEGVRYFDTSPWYGLGLSERRMGVFLQGRPRDEFIISTKIGRLLTPDASKTGDQGIWKEIPPFAYRYDYTADGVRRSIEASLHRLGLARIDIVFIHDLSPDNGDLRPQWTEYFDTALSGAMRELTRMREEGLISAWGMGVNELEPARRALQESDPDIILQAAQYTLIKHEEALDTLFPVARANSASIVIGTPLMVGFLAGRHRYLWSGEIPEGAIEKRARISRVAQDHGTDLLTAALQFCNAPDVVSAVIPGARNAQQVRENASAIRAETPPEFWRALKQQGLIAERAPTPS